MPLSMSQASFSSLLLLLVSNLFLWEGVASVPECNSRDGRCEVSIEEMFDRAIKQAETFRGLAANLYEEFFRNPNTSETFLGFLARIIKNDKVVIVAQKYCFTSAIDLPRTREQSNMIKPKRYLKLLIKFVDSWTKPLAHFVHELQRVKFPDAILSKAKDIQEGSSELVADIKWILKKVYPDAQMKERYPAWPPLSHLGNEKFRALAFLNLASCLRGDSGKTTNHLKFLKCRVTTNKHC